MTHQPIVGAWRFDVDSATLTKPGCIARLEDRSARTLALLCRRRGEVVSKVEILEEVWNGRAVSANSVAIVIADLRRALGENARAPQHIETVGKRGYRLRQEPERQSLTPMPTPGRSAARRLVWTFSGIALMIAMLLGLLWHELLPLPSVAVSLASVQNETGQARLDPLASALAALVEERIAGMQGVVATEMGPKPAISPAKHRLHMRARLIIWNDTPTLSMSAVDPSTGKVVWSGMAVGQPNAIADATIAKLADFWRHL